MATFSLGTPILSGGYTAPKIEVPVTAGGTYVITSVTSFDLIDTTTDTTFPWSIAANGFSNIPPLYIGSSTAGNGKITLTGTYPFTRLTPGHSFRLANVKANMKLISSPFTQVNNVTGTGTPTATVTIASAPTPTTTTDVTSVVMKFPFANSLPSLPDGTTMSLSPAPTGSNSFSPDNSSGTDSVFSFSGLAPGTSYTPTIAGTSVGGVTPSAVLPAFATLPATMSLGALIPSASSPGAVDITAVSTSAGVALPGNLNLALKDTNGSAIGSPLSPSAGGTFTIPAGDVSSLQQMVLSGSGFTDVSQTVKKLTLTKTATSSSSLSYSIGVSSGSRPADGTFTVTVKQGNTDVTPAPTVSDGAFTVSSLSASTSYAVTVSTSDVNFLPISSTDTTDTASVSTPATPQNLTVNSTLQAQHATFNFVTSDTLAAGWAVNVYGGAEELMSVPYNSSTFVKDGSSYSVEVNIGNGGLFNFKISIVNNGTESALSNATTPETTTVYFSPAAPTNVSTLATSSTVKVSWTNSGTSYVDRHVIIPYDSTGALTAKIQTVAMSASPSNSIVFKIGGEGGDLDFGTYTFKVKAVCTEAIYSSEVASSSVTVVAPSSDHIVTISAITSGNQSATLTFTVPILTYGESNYNPTPAATPPVAYDVKETVTSYTIKYKKVTDSEFLSETVQSAPSVTPGVVDYTPISHTIGSLDNNAAYMFKVIANYTQQMQIHGDASTLSTKNLSTLASSERQVAPYDPATVSASNLTDTLNTFTGAASAEDKIAQFKSMLGDAYANSSTTQTQFWSLASVNNVNGYLPAGATNDPAYAVIPATINNAKQVSFDGLDNASGPAQAYMLDGTYNSVGSVIGIDGNAVSYGNTLLTTNSASTNIGNKAVKLLGVGSALFQVSDLLVISSSSVTDYTATLVLAMKANPAIYPSSIAAVRLTQSLMGSIYAKAGTITDIVWDNSKWTYAPESGELAITGLMQGSTYGIRLIMVSNGIDQLVTEVTTTGVQPKMEIVDVIPKATSIEVRYTYPAGITTGSNVNVYNDSSYTSAIPTSYSVTPALNNSNEQILSNMSPVYKVELSVSLTDLYRPAVAHIDAFSGFTYGKSAIWEPYGRLVGSEIATTPIQSPYSTRSETGSTIDSITFILTDIAAGALTIRGLADYGGAYYYKTTTLPTSNAEGYSYYTYDGSSLTIQYGNLPQSISAFRVTTSDGKGPTILAVPSTVLPPTFEFINMTEDGFSLVITSASASNSTGYEIGYAKVETNMQSYTFVPYSSSISGLESGKVYAVVMREKYGIDGVTDNSSIQYAYTRAITSTEAAAALSITDIAANAKSGPSSAAAALLVKNAIELKQKAAGVDGLFEEVAASSSSLSTTDFVGVMGKQSFILDVTTYDKTYVSAPQKDIDGVVIGAAVIRADQIATTAGAALLYLSDVNTTYTIKDGQTEIGKIVTADGSNFTVYSGSNATSYTPVSVVGGLYTVGNKKYRFVAPGSMYFKVIGIMETTVDARPRTLRVQIGQDGSTAHITNVTGWAALNSVNTTSAVGYDSGVYDATTGIMEFRGLAPERTYYMQFRSDGHDDINNVEGITLAGPLMTATPIDGASVRLDLELSYLYLSSATYSLKIDGVSSGAGTLTNNSLTIQNLSTVNHTFELTVLGNGGSYVSDIVSATLVDPTTAPIISASISSTGVATVDATGMPTNSVLVAGVGASIPTATLLSDATSISRDTAVGGTASISLGNYTIGDDITAAVVTPDGLYGPPINRVSITPNNNTAATIAAPVIQTENSVLVDVSLNSAPNSVWIKGAAVTGVSSFTWQFQAEGAASFTNVSTSNYFVPGTDATGNPYIEIRYTTAASSQWAGLYRLAGTATVGYPAPTASSSVKVVQLATPVLTASKGVGTVDVSWPKTSFKFINGSTDGYPEHKVQLFKKLSNSNQTVFIDNLTADEISKQYTALDAATYIVEVTTTRASSSLYGYVVGTATSGNLIVTAVSSVAAVCFLADAPVLTPSGYRAISSIKEGDLVRTAAGLNVAVKRVFRKEYVAGASVNPFVIPKGSFGALRALPISPNHEVMTAKGMVQAKELGLPRMKMAGSFTYYNLELEDWVRDNLVVAGVECESLAPAARITMSKPEFARFVRTRYGPAAAARLKTVCFEQADGSVSMPALK